MKIAIHQPNFIPWFPYFYKMHRADLFVLLTECQFEKNGYQNRARIAGKWWTLPVQSGLMPIKQKITVDGSNLCDLSEAWIRTVAATIGINPYKIKRDFPTEKRGTERLIEICKKYGADVYLTNPDAKEKYLNEDAMLDAGIRIEYIECPIKEHVFELFHKNGIEGTIELLNKDWRKSKNGVS